MEMVPNHRLFKATSTLPSLSAISCLEAANSLTSPFPISYIEIMLCEYSNLVNSLTKLNASQFQSIQMDIDEILTQLTDWLDDASSTNKVELFSAMRVLKQKAKKLNNLGFASSYMNDI